MDLISNSFIKNRGIDGGALFLMSIPKVYFLYTDDKNGNIEEEEDINIINNIFSNNTAYNYGGAIYSEYNKLYLAKSKNNTVSYNEAGIMGGGLYTPKLIQKNLFDLEDCKFINNIVSYHRSDYTTKPSYISLITRLETSNTVITGDYFPLEFSVHGENGDMIEDVTHHYSELTLKLSLIEKNNVTESQYFYFQKRNTTDEYSDENSIVLPKYKLLGNTGTFRYGKILLNNFQIFAVPNTYIIKIDYENYDDNLDINVEEIEIDVIGCNSNQIKMYNSYNIEYCVEPECLTECPVGKSAVCVPYNEKDNHINDPSKNKCECLLGWKGSYCNEREFLNYQ